MNKFLLCFIFFFVVLLSFSVVSASWFSNSFGKMTGNAVISKSDVLGECVKTCSVNNCSSFSGFSKKICTSRNHKFCLNSCKTTPKSSVILTNKQVLKVVSLPSSGCVGNVCKVYEGEVVVTSGNNFSLAFISSNQAKLKMNYELSKVLEENQAFIFSNNLKLLVIDISVREDAGDKNFVIFSTHRNNFLKSTLNISSVK